MKIGDRPSAYSATDGQMNTRKLHSMARNSALLLMVVAGATACSEDILELTERTVTPIGATGGIARSADGAVQLTFPAGSLSDTTEIMITTVRERTVPRLVGPLYEFGPDGQMFASPVTITIDAVSNGEELAIANTDGAYPEVLASSSWDATNGKLTARLEHFSSYGVVTVYNPCAGRSCGNPCTICDPQDSSCVEPGPANAPKACNRSGLCVEASLAMCSMIADASVIDSGNTPGPDSSVTPDAGVIPDATPNAPDGGVPPLPDAGVMQCTSTFTQNPQPQVDLLLVIDNSCSMADEQAALGRGFPLLLSTFTNNNVDFHIGVTTTDVTATGARGSLMGANPVLTSSTPNLAMEFSHNVTVGTRGSPFESGLEASRLAFSPNTPSTFMRDTASKTIIYVSDEDDQSASTTATYVQFLSDLAGATTVQANTITGDLGSGCQGPGGSATPGVRYDAVRVATGGVFDSVCTGQWPRALSDVGGAGFGYVRKFVLSQPVVGTNIVVTVDGVVVPSNGGSNWSYDSAQNTVSFTASAVPAPGATIVVTSGC